jgi:K+-transporting ATPase c subunit
MVEQSLGFLGEACINVLVLNQALDELSQNLEK